MKAGLGDLIFCLAIWFTPLAVLGLFWLVDVKDQRLSGQGHAGSPPSGDIDVLD